MKQKQNQRLNKKHKENGTSCTSQLNSRRMVENTRGYREFPRKPRPLAARMNWKNKFKITIDRDLNASLNIRNIGINTLGHSGINACGDSSLELSLKQEKECLEN